MICSHCQTHFCFRCSKAVRIFTFFPRPPRSRRDFPFLLTFFLSFPLLFFLYRTSQLPPSQPYTHYQNPGTPCFQQLFDAEEVAAFNRGVANVAEPNEGAGGAWEEGFGDEGEWEDLAGFDRLVIEDFDGPAGRRRWNGL